MFHAAQKFVYCGKLIPAFSQEVATFELTFRSFLYGAIYQSDICAFAVQFCISKKEESGTKNDKRKRLNGNGKIGYFMYEFLGEKCY